MKYLLSNESLKLSLKLFLLLIIASAPAYGSGISSEAFAGFGNPKDTVKKRVYEHTVLDGHKFITNSNIGSPFIQTFAENRLGAGQTINLDIPKITINGGEIVQLKGELIFTNLNLEYQQNIKDWMAFNVGFNLIGRLGTKAGSLLSEGVNVAGGYEFGWLFKLYESKKTILSGTIDIASQSFTFVNLKDFVKGVIDSGKITKDNKLVETIPVLRAGAGVRGAYAFNRTFGLTYYAKVKNGETANRSDNNSWFFNYGLAFDADLMPGQNVPIGFLLGFYSIDLPSSAGTIENDPKNIIMQINYTGKEDLNLGLEFNYQTYKPTDFDRNINFVSALFSMRYFF